MHSRKILTTLLVLLLSASFMFAASAQDLHQDFVAAVQSGDVQGAIDSYENLQERVAKDEEDIQRDIQKATDEHALYYRAARHGLPDDGRHSRDVESQSCV